MSPRVRLIVTVAVSVAVLLAFFFFAVRPRQNELGEIRDQIEEEEAREVQLQAELNRLRDLQARAPELQAELDEIRGFVPPRDEVADFIFQVQEAADQAGIGFIEISPELPTEAPEGAQIAEIRHTIGAQGGFFAIQDFVRRLYQLDRALRIDLLEMRGEVEEGEVTINLSFTARIFFELPEVQAPTTPAPPEPEEEDGDDENENENENEKP
jgi:Tfp pilus assembly protein PilO